MTQYQHAMLIIRRHLDLRDTLPGLQPADQVHQISQVLADLVDQIADTEGDLEEEDDPTPGE